MAEALIDGVGSGYFAKVNEHNELRVSTAQEGYATQIAYDGTIPQYIGKSAPPANTGSATWQIKKITNDGTNPTAINWASGTSGYKSFTFVWNSRAGYTYV